MHMPRPFLRLRARRPWPLSAVLLPLRPTACGRLGRATAVVTSSSRRTIASAAPTAAYQAPSPPTRGGQDELHAAASELRGAVAALEASGSTVLDGSDVDKAQRAEIVRAATAVLAAVKNPTDQWVDQTLQSALMAATRLFSDWGVFEALPADGSAISYADLAAAVDAQPRLIARIGGVLTSQGLLRLVGADRVAHTARSRIYVGETSAGLVCGMNWDNGFVVYAKYPDYFREHGRREPETMIDIPGTYAYGKPELGFYEMIEQDPVRMRRFFKGMGFMQERMPIAGIYDFGWAVRAAAQAPVGTATPLFVNVGGGGGQAIVAIRDEFPGLPLERFVLQDRAEVIAASERADDPALRGIQRQVIDFHHEQPVKGAPIYWSRRCLHNHSDSVSIDMLRTIADAMGPESRLLLQEDVMDGTGPPNVMSAMLDFMMLGFGGKQRTLAMWEELVTAAGLRISGVSKGKGAWTTMSVVECVKV